MSEKVRPDIIQPVILDSSTKLKEAFSDLGINPDIAVKIFQGIYPEGGKDNSHKIILFKPKTIPNAILLKLVLGNGRNVEIGISSDQTVLQEGKRIIKLSRLSLAVKDSQGKLVLFDQYKRACRLNLL